MKKHPIEMQKTVVITNEQLKHFYNSMLKESVAINPSITLKVVDFLEKEGFKPDFYDDIDENGNTVKRVCINALGKVSKQPIQKHSLSKMLDLMDANKTLRNLVKNDKDRRAIFTNILKNWIEGTINWDGMFV